jgi:hypothetical protein
VILGLVVGGVGVWFLRAARPAAGALIDRIHDARDRYTIEIVHEASSDRAFLRWRDDASDAHWEALIPPYAGAAGRPAVATSATAVSVRIVRDRPELWVFATGTNGEVTKLGAIGLEGYAPGGWDRAGRSTVVTGGDGVRGFEVVDGKTGTAVVAIDLGRGSVLWHREFPGPIKGLWVLPDGRIEVATSNQSWVLAAQTGGSERD